VIDSRIRAEKIQELIVIHIPNPDPPTFGQNHVQGVIVVSSVNIFHVDIELGTDLLHHFRPPPRKIFITDAPQKNH
jgi:hypothetical protein